MFSDPPVRIRMLESQIEFLGGNVSLFCDAVHYRNIRWYKNMDKEIQSKTSNKYPTFY